MPQPVQPVTAWVDLVDRVARVDWVAAANAGLVDYGFHGAA